MKELYLESKNGIEPINPEIAEKYHLSKGTYSPFTQSRIVGKYGDFNFEPDNRDDYIAGSTLTNVPRDGFHEDGIDSMDNGFEMSTSEIIDFAQGTDSTD